MLGGRCGGVGGVQQDGQPAIGPPGSFCLARSRHSIVSVPLDIAIRIRSPRMLVACQWGLKLESSLLIVKVASE